jgi:hypothetical protein
MTTVEAAGGRPSTRAVGARGVISTMCRAGGQRADGRTWLSPVRDRATAALWDIRQTTLREFSDGSVYRDAVDGGQRDA